MNKKWSMPKKDCMFQGFIEVNGELHAVCDAVGDDVSRAFCEYCQYWSKAYNVKPCDFAPKFAMALWDISQKLKKEGKVSRN